MTSFRKPSKCRSVARERRDIDVYDHFAIALDNVTKKTGDDGRACEKEEDRLGDLQMWREAVQLNGTFILLLDDERDQPIGISNSTSLRPSILMSSMPRPASDGSWVRRRTQATIKLLLKLVRVLRPNRSRAFKPHEDHT